jgi:hypothetical protein
MSLVLSKKIIRYLKRAVLVNYLGRLVATLALIALVLGIGVYVGGRWAILKAPYGHSVTLFHLGQALILLLILFRFAWPKLRRPLSLEEMAVRLEKKDPRLNECLSSALEFSYPDPLLEETLAPSAGFMPGFYQDALVRVGARQRFSRIVPWYFWMISILLSLFVVFWFNLVRFGPFTGEDIWRAYNEFFLANPYRPLHSLTVEPGFGTVLKGESLTVQANLQGPGNHSAVIRYSMKGFPQEIAEMKTREFTANVFEFEFENLQSDLTYQIEAGPEESLQYTVEVKDPPELTFVQLTYFFPEFMKRNVEVVPAGQGAAGAPVGTTVEVSTRWSQPMDRIFMTVNDGEPKPMEKKGSFWKAQFPLQAAGRYVLSGSSQTGVRIRDGMEFPINAVEDLPPEIEWVWPEEDLDLSDVGTRLRVPLKYRVRDDYGIERIHLFAGAPGRATRAFEITNLEGKEVEFAQTYKFSLMPYDDVPVVRVYFVANDNHPGNSNQTLTQIRRLYLQPPGTFSEAEDASGELEANTDPFELTALELFHLIKTQREQNAALSETSEATPGQKIAWKDNAEKLSRMTSQTSLRVYNRAGQVRVGSGDAAPQQISPEGVPNQAAQPPAPATGEEGEVLDLATRLDRVVTRLIGDIRRLEELVPGNVPTGTTALDYELRQLDAGANDRIRRSREEGERALRELEAAFKELTGKNPPKDYTKANKEREEQEEKEKKDVDDLPSNEDEGDDVKEDEEDQGAADAEGEDPGDGEQEGGSEGEEFVIGEGDGKVARSLQGGDTGGGVTDKVEGESGASLPTNVYAPSVYTLDPDSVHLDTASSRLLQRAVAENLEGIDLSEYRKQPIPPEYESVATEYNRMLLGE